MIKPLILGFLKWLVIFSKNQVVIFENGFSTYIFCFRENNGTKKSNLVTFFEPAEEVVIIIFQVSWNVSVFQFDVSDQFIRNGNHRVIISLQVIFSFHNHVDALDFETDFDTAA